MKTLFNKLKNKFIAPAPTDKAELTPEEKLILDSFKKVIVKKVTPSDLDVVKHKDPYQPD